MHAARDVFGREGYAGANLDVIASEAEVSKRTIYNHYTDKEDLFLSVILEGSTQVAEVHKNIADRHLSNIVDTEQSLVDFAVEWANSPAAFAGHFALVRTINAEAARISPAVLWAWRETGPLAFQRELARHLGLIGGRGLLDVPDPEAAATHFNLLTFVSVMQPSFYFAVPLGEAEVSEIVIDGVKTFLRLYAPPRHPVIAH
ncbi:TetR/AcrR family transcriptional regulator [Mangrovihabitans endophyticus]|uniref:TetR family transcriptional regulator n=1 Tax=Mangrovihabitans endophyticus TaxID=1751298 RepID=A0A8J3BWH3_9ACTN|nr:TetR family transcriptional regulator [Mangrovihabitans endophyticus]GGK74080.1 TetR family transcriptional regulator [Mangrovihabitans endophyticus]